MCNYCNLGNFDYVSVSVFQRLSEVEEIFQRLSEVPQQNQMF